MSPGSPASLDINDSQMKNMIGSLIQEVRVFCSIPVVVHFCIIDIAIKLARWK